MKTIELTPDAVTDTERAIAVQCALAFAERLGWPEEEYYLKPLATAFCNGVAFARQCADPEVQEQLRRKYEPLADELFGKE